MSTLLLFFFLRHCFRAKSVDDTHICSWDLFRSSGVRSIFSAVDSASGYPHSEIWCVSHGNFETLSSKKSPATQEEVCEVYENGFSEMGMSCLGLVGRRKELLWSFRAFIYSDSVVVEASESLLVFTSSLLNGTVSSNESVPWGQTLYLCSVFSPIKQ